MLSLSYGMYCSWIINTRLFFFVGYDFGVQEFSLKFKLLFSSIFFLMYVKLCFFFQIKDRSTIKREKRVYREKKAYKERPNCEATQLAQKNPHASNSKSETTKNPMSLSCQLFFLDMSCPIYVGTKIQAFPLMDLLPLSLSLCRSDSPLSSFYRVNSNLVNF